MKTPTSDFPPLTRRQLDLLEGIKAEKEKFKTLAPRDLKAGTRVPELYKIQERIDDLSVKALRSGLLRGRPAESRRPGFFLESYYHEGRLVATGDEIKPAFGDFHPDLLPWAKNHFIEWIRMLRFRRHDARETLRETLIVGIETGMRRPEDLADIERFELIKQMVLRLRAVKDENDDSLHTSPAGTDEPPPKTFAEMLEKARKRRVVTAKMLNRAQQQYKLHPKKKRKRATKNLSTWDAVIEILWEKGLLTKKMTRIAFKKMLKIQFPGDSWDEI